MQAFMMAHLWLILLIGGAVLVGALGLTMLHSFIVSQRLHFLTMDVLEHDPESFQHTHVIMCHTCKGKRHVSHYRYGRGNAMKSVYLCYLCVPRFEHHLRTAYPPASLAPTESPKDVSYAQFRVWTGQTAQAETPPSTPYSYRVPQRQAYKRGR